MADRDILATMAEEFGRAFGPLEFALQSQDNFSDVMRDLGWTLDTIPEALASLQAPLATISQLLDGGPLDADGLPAALHAISSTLGAVDQISNATGLPGSVDAGAFTAELPRQLVDYLLVEYLLDYQPTVGHLLKLLGVIRLELVEAAGKRPAFVRRAVAWRTSPACSRRRRPCSPMPTSGARTRSTRRPSRSTSRTWARRSGSPRRSTAFPTASPRSSRRARRRSPRCTSTSCACHCSRRTSARSTSRRASACSPCRRRPPRSRGSRSCRTSTARRAGRSRSPTVPRSRSKRESTPTGASASSARPSGVSALASILSPPTSATAALALGVAVQGADGNPIVLAGSRDASRLEVRSASVRGGVRGASTSGIDAFAEVALQGARDRRQARLG